MEMDFYSAIESVREKIERGEKYYALLNDKPKWNQYCASLYAIEDAQCAIEAYTSYEFPTDIKGKYLYIYGLLQALFLQQDAANDISTALLGKKIDFKQEYPSLFEIREIRNDTVGHPTRRGQANCNNQAYVQIVQMSMSRQGFNYATYRAVNDYKFEEKYPIFKLGITKEAIIEFTKTTPELAGKFKYSDDGNKIRLDTKKSKDAFLKLMNDSFLRSELTKQYYEASTKDNITQASN